jgi:hypothetical protein
MGSMVKSDLAVVRCSLSFISTGENRLIYGELSGNNELEKVEVGSYAANLSLTKLVVIIRDYSLDHCWPSSWIVDDEQFKQRLTK